jgi:Uma2 family endonuclease
MDAVDCRKAGAQEAVSMSVSTTRPEPAPQVAPIDRNGAISPLESGDRLSAEEFMERYEAMPGLKKAELIAGVVYVPSPVRHRYHGRQHHLFLNWLGHYEAGTPGVEGGDNSTLLLDEENVPQPDCLMFIQPEHGGHVKIDEEGYIHGAPDLVAEVAASSVSYDLHDKLRTYANSGVREYLVWRVRDLQVDWFVLRGKNYEVIKPAQDGTLRSTVFPGLWLDPAALMRGDLASVLAVVQRGLESPDHAAFKADLQRARVEPTA